MTTCVVGVTREQLAQQIVGTYLLLQQTEESRYQAMINFLYDHKIGHELEYILMRPFCTPPFVQVTDDGLDFSGFGWHQMLFNPGNVALSCNIEVADADDLQLLPFFLRVADFESIGLSPTQAQIVDEKDRFSQRPTALMRQFWLLRPLSGAMPLDLRPSYQGFDPEAENLASANDELGWIKQSVAVQEIGQNKVVMLTAAIRHAGRHRSVRLHITVIKPPKKFLVLS